MSTTVRTGCNDCSCFRNRSRSVIKVSESLLLLSLHLFCYTHIVQCEHVFGVGLQDFLKKEISLRGAALLEKAHCFDIRVIHVQRCVADVQRCSHGRATELALTRQINDCVTGVLGSEGIELLCTIDLALEFRDVSQVVQGESVVGIK